MRRRILIPLLLLALLVPVAFCIYLAQHKTTKAAPVQESLDEAAADQSPIPIDFSKRVSVPLNRGAEIKDGFRGNVHPALHGHTAMEVAASWYCKDESQAFANTHQRLSGLFQGLKVAVPTKTYTERDFSTFLPAKELGKVGQLWALDLDKVAVFLKQFHPYPSMHLVCKGKRAGPDGAFAILRAVSPSHLDIAFRIHAEFDVRPRPLKRGFPTEAWYTPACFLGRLLLNKNSGTVDYFGMALPTDNTQNVHLTVADDDPMSETDFRLERIVHSMMHVDQMELQGGNRDLVDTIHWTDQLKTKAAYDRLTKIFFQFKQIDWVAFDQAQAIADQKHKPIFAVVVMGALDDQSC